MTSPLLVAKDIKKRFETPEGSVEVMTGASLTLDHGQTASLMGESGSGKSTLLHMIGGLENPDSGRITLQKTNGKNLEITSLSEKGKSQLRRRDIGVIFQHFNLIPSLTVGQNLTFHARLAGRYDPKWTNDLARRLALDTMLSRYPEQMSGGQQQRLAVGRTFAARPPLVLADEPTGNLDEKTSDQVLGLALDLVQETQAGLLMVTHSARLAARMDQKLVLEGGQIK